MTKIGATILLVAILVTSAFVGLYGNAQGWFTPEGAAPSAPWSQPAATPTAPSNQVVGAWSGPLYLSVVDKVGGASFTTSTVTIDQIAAVGGVFDFISGPSKAVTQSANPQSEVRIWNQGDEIIVMPDCTGNPSNGLDYYPVVFYIKSLYQGADIWELNPDNGNQFIQIGTNPITYRVDTTTATKLPQKVSQYEASNIKYWNIGDLYLYPRQAAADFDMYLTHGGTTLASVTDASTWVDTAVEITANATLTSTTNDKIEFKMVGANANLGWGKSFYVFSSTGKVQRYGAVIVMTTAMTAIGSDALTGKGWIPMTTSQLYAEKGFYKELSPAFPAKGQKAGWSVEIPIDCASATAATAYKVSIWVVDCQNLDNVAALGTSTSVPTAYGFVTAYGVGEVLQNTAVTFSSGAGATMQLEAYLTTPS
jgi:hypothetical protein